MNFLAKTKQNDEECTLLHNFDDLVELVMIFEVRSESMLSILIQRREQKASIYVLEIVPNTHLNP